MGKKIRLKQAAKQAGVHSDTIIRWQAKGHLTTHRTGGGHRRVDEDELRALLARRREAFERTASG